MGKQDRRLGFWQNFTCGGCAGVGSRSLTSPLDVVKILFQVGTKETQTGFFQAFRNIYKSEGLHGFWKGNGVACLRLFPFNAIQFAFFNEFKKRLTNPHTGKMPPWASGTGGGIAGMVATVSVYPLDLVKTRLTVQKRKGGDKLYNGIWDALTKIYKSEGLLALFQGVSCSIYGAILFSGFTFMFYELLDWSWGKPKNELKGWQSFVNGCIAGACAQTFSFPFDTVRKKMQAQSRTGAMKADVQFNGMMDCFGQTIKAKGILGLWAGTLANLAKVAPYAGFMFYIFEWTKRVFLYYNGFTTSPFRELLTPGVDQSLTPHQLKKILKEKKLTASHPNTPTTPNKTN